MKVLPTERASDPTILRAVHARGPAASKVHHPNVARVLDIGLLAGDALRRLRVRCRSDAGQGGRREGAAAPHAAAQSSPRRPSGLYAAHQLGLIHRDVKPGNLSVLPDRRVKLIDLGLTHMLENPWTPGDQADQHEGVRGGDRPHRPRAGVGCEIDARSDVYSLGSTFYYLLDRRGALPGTRPRDDGRAADSRQSVPGRLRAEVPREIDAIVRKMGAKDPHERTRRPGGRRRDAPWLPLEQWQALGIAHRASASRKPPVPKKHSFFARLFGW